MNILLRLIFKFCTANHLCCDFARHRRGASEKYRTPGNAGRRERTTRKIPKWREGRQLFRPAEVRGHPHAHYGRERVQRRHEVGLGGAFRGQSRVVTDFLSRLGY